MPMALFVDDEMLLLILQLINFPLLGKLFLILPLQRRMIRLTSISDARTTSLSPNHHVL